MAMTLRPTWQPLELDDLFTELTTCLLASFLAYFLAYLHGVLDGGDLAADVQPLKLRHLRRTGLARRAARSPRADGRRVVDGDPIGERGGQAEPLGDPCDAAVGKCENVKCEV